MKKTAEPKPQCAWSIVSTVRGYVRYDYMRFTRKAVIADVIKDWRKYSSPKVNGADMTDAQLWRWIKARHGWEVRRVEMKVLP